MTLEDFFTLTEMNNGLTSPSQVRELISAMQKERDCIVKNAADRTRQRSTVARAIAATENEECLDLFIQLDGLHFISSWLKDAQTLSNDSNNSFVEESITHFFRALEKLHLDYENSVVFGIRTAVEILVNHKSSEVQDRARVLLESWKEKKDNVDVPLSDVDKSRASTDEETRETSVKDNGHELTRDDQVVSKSSDDVSPEQVESAHEDENHVSSSPKPTVEPFSPASSKQDILDSDSNFHGLKSKTSEGHPLTPSSDAVPEMEDVTEQNSHNSFSGGSKNSSDEDLSDIDSDGKSDSGENPNEITPKDGEKSWGNYLSGIKDYSSDDDLKNDNAFGKKQMDAELDPLEVARQVAMEVERELVDYREESCSTSPKNLPRSSSPQPNSPASVKQSPANEGSLMDEAGATDSATSTKNPVPQENAVSQITEAAPKTEKIACNFIDLNQEVLMEDSDHLHHHDPEVKLPAPVSVVSASRASAADPKLPCSPLQFEGNLGWKGSALTSAFRRVPETDLSTGGSSGSNSKQRQGWCLDFDLNVAEFVDDSNVETNSNRSEHLEFDLNRMSGDWQIGNNLSQFPSSSQQPLRNVNLNGGPSLFNAKKATSQNLNNKSNGDSAISIMGTRVEVNRNDFAFATQTPELGFDINLGRTGNLAVPYVNSSGYPYIAPGPFTGPMYGPARPVPYMVDSRGMPVISHMGQQPFVINMNGPTACNGVGQSRDLNSGMLVEGGTKDPPVLGLFLNSDVSSVGGKRKEPESGYGDHYYPPSKHYAQSHWRQS